MTNAEIIFRASYELMMNGVIGTTGRKIVVEDANGNPLEFVEPEEIHTFAGWKERGYSVRKGEHAVAQIVIWKAGQKKLGDGEADANGAPVMTERTRMFLKNAHFFAASQVDKAKPKARATA